MIVIAFQSVDNLMKAPAGTSSPGTASGSSSWGCSSKTSASRVVQFGRLEDWKAAIEDMEKERGTGSQG